MPMPINFPEPMLNTNTFNYPHPDPTLNTNSFNCPLPETVMPSAPPLNPSFNPQTLNLITQVSNQLHDFVNLCESTLWDLSSAQSTEMMDAGTSNWSIIGFLVSRSSHAKNHAVADKIDLLKNQAWNINQNLLQLGTPGMHLPMDLDGNSIRMAENAEHNFLANWLTSHAYSSYASANTLGQLRFMTQKIQNVRSIAMNIMCSLPTQGQSRGHMFTASRI